MALCIIVLPPGPPLLAAGEPAAVFITGGGAGAGLTTSAPPPWGADWSPVDGPGGGASASPRRSRSPEGSGSEGAADVCGAGFVRPRAERCGRSRLVWVQTGALAGDLGRGLAAWRGQGCRPGGGARASLPSPACVLQTPKGVRRSPRRERPLAANTGLSPLFRINISPPQGDPLLFLCHPL